MADIDLSRANGKDHAKVYKSAIVVSGIFVIGCFSMMSSTIIDSCGNGYERATAVVIGSSTALLVITVFFSFIVAYTCIGYGGGNPPLSLVNCASCTVMTMLILGTSLTLCSIVMLTVAHMSCL